MAITNVTKNVDLTGRYLNLPAVSGMQHGYWYYYLPKNAGNTLLNSSIQPYQWGTALTLATANLVIDGTIPLITENWQSANTQYHGGCIEWIGAGVNDITGTIENDAFFFAHLGALAASDQPYYWDRAYLAQGSAEWQFYQYHLHFPNIYEDFDNGRIVFSAGGFIVPTDKSFGYTIDTGVTSMGTGYTSVLSRIHTPSVGGAHNSHNDINLPVTPGKNYLMGGILKGSSDRFHAFYLTANGAQWDVFARTYNDQAASYTAEVNLGTYDLADPDFNPVTTTGTQSRYPIRASCGKLIGSTIYIPVIYNNPTSGFDLKIWSITSSDEISAGSLQITTILTGVSQRPDCHLNILSQELYALVSDIANGGVKLWSLNTTTQTWTDEGTIVTNSNTNYTRVHGFDYNSSDVKWYAILSGNTSNTGTYTGAGVYSFTLTGTFDGYTHLDYSSANNAFIKRNALSAGHIEYDQTFGTLARNANTEPQGIAAGTNILTYESTNAKFINKSQINIGGSSYYYHGITLADGRRVLGGQIENNENNLGAGDLLLSFFADLDADDNIEPQHFAWGGAGDDYITGLYESTTEEAIWITGYTKSELVEKKDMKIHGYLRNLNDGTNQIEWKDITTDATGNVYVVGNHSDNYIVCAKYSYNYELIWQKTIDAGANTDIAYGIALDSTSNVYVSGATSNDGQGGTDVLLVKTTSTGNLVFSKAYGISGNQTGISVAVVSKANTEYVVVPSVSESNTTFLVTATNGDIYEQKKVNNLVVNRVRVDAEQNNTGRFMFAGNNAANPTVAKFGVAELGAGSLIKWERTYSSNTNAYDIKNVAANTYAIVGTENTNGLVLKVSVSGTEGSYTITKDWAKNLANTTFYSILVNAADEIQVVGYTTSSNISIMGMNDAMITKFDTNGNLMWQNALGHDMDERLVAVTNDITGENIISAGWSESHSFGRDGILFRSWSGGYGTGHYHLENSAGTVYVYQKTNLANTVNSNTLSTPTSTITTDTFIATTPSLTVQDGVFTNSVYDGSYGPNGVFMFYIAKVSLQAVQQHLNSEQHIQNELKHRVSEYTDSIFTFWQVAVPGDGSADDGNIFGYDIIQVQNGPAAGKIFAIGQTSGDVGDTNLGISGAYDYLLVEFDPNTEEFEFYQNSGQFDEETYALTELADGRIAFTGRFAGTYEGITSNGGYDIFLGIYNPVTEISEYYATGTGFEDKGVNVHDLGANTLAVVFSTQGQIGPETFGSEDIGVIKFNYSTDAWGNAYQTGSSTSEIFEQNGKPSALLDDGRIAITGYTSGVFADDSQTYGSTDIFLGIIDTNTGIWKKYQVGSGAADFGSSLHKTGDRLLIAGSSHALFSDEESTGIYVEFDAPQGVGAKAAVN